MTVYKKKLSLTSHGGTPTFINITEELRAAIKESDFDKMLLCIFDTLADSLGNFGSLAEANADFTLLVTNDDKRREREAATALDDFCNAVDIYNFLLEFRSFVVHMSSHSFTSFLALNQNLRPASRAASASAATRP